MKKLRTIFIFILFGQITFAQDNSVQKDFLLFEKGYTLQTLVDEDLELNDVINSSDSSTSEKDFAEEIKEIILERALENYQELIDSFPNSKLLYRAMNNKGYIELDLDDIEEAEKTFKKIIDSEADDEEIGGPGLGLMSEPYTNYKNRAAKALANIYLEKEDFAEALKFLDLTKKYPYYHFCGNEYEADEIYMSTLYAKCYIGLKDYEKAVKFLLPHIIENGLADNSSLVDLTYETLLKQYSKEKLKTEYEQAFANYYIEKEKYKKKYWKGFRKNKQKMIDEVKSSDRQYLGYINDKGEKIILIQLVDFREDPYRLKDLVDKQFISGWHGWFETNIRRMHYNIDSGKLTVNEDF